MINLLYLSDYIRPTTNKIGFVGTVLRRIFGILLRHHKKLILLELNYQKKYQFDQSFLVIRYRFKNALWYHFKGIKRTTESGIIILNRSKIPEFPVVLTVYGLFRKKIFLIEASPVATMQTNAFRTKINNPRDLKYYTRPIALSVERIHPARSKIKMKHRQIQVKYTPINMRKDSIHFEYPLFNQTEFL